MGGTFPWTFVALVWVVPTSQWLEEAAGTQCAGLRGVGPALLCRSAADILLGFPAGKKPDRNDLSLESNLNTRF